jgi:hypothetical protein
MLLNFLNSYQSTIDDAYLRVADIQKKIAEKETFIGNDKTLDRLYAHSILMLGIIDVLENDDNANPMGNETFLNELNFLLTLNY